MRCSDYLRTVVVILRGVFLEHGYRRSFARPKHDAISIIAFDFIRTQAVQAAEKDPDFISSRRDRYGRHIIIQSRSSYSKLPRSNFYAAVNHLIPTGEWIWGFRLTDLSVHWHIQVAHSAYSDNSRTSGHSFLKVRVF
jgi:hypothetical protein